jgi:hypothetical protein
VNARRRILVYTVVNDPFRFGLVVTARTLLAQNPDLDVHYRIVYHDELSPLAAAHREFIARHVPSVEFVHVDVAPYANIFRLRDEVFATPKRLWAAFLILEAFREANEGATVLCLDCDMICTGPLGPEILRDDGFAAVEARSREGKPLGFFNTGVMVIGRDHRGPEVFERIMSVTDTSRYVPSSGKADQAVLSLIYRPDNASCLPPRYNVTRRQLTGLDVRAELERRAAVFFHFVGAKPWSVSLDARDGYEHGALDLWDETVASLLTPEEHLEYLRFFRSLARHDAMYFAQNPPPLVPSERIAVAIVRALRDLVRPLFFWRKRGY